MGPHTISYLRSVVTDYRRYQRRRGNQGAELTEQTICDAYNRQNGRCHYTNTAIGFAATLAQNEKAGGGTTASVDRVNSDGGYEAVNVQLTHKRVNAMKGNLSHDEFIQICGLVWQNAGKPELSEIVIQNGLDKPVNYK